MLNNAEGVIRASGSNSRVRLDVRALLEFFDEAPQSSRGHATAIAAVAGEELGLALLVDYFKETGVGAELVSYKCTPGTRRGSRLDGWVRAGGTLYQVEVKNWSAHAIGGRPLAIDAPPDECAAYRRKFWNNEWGPSGFKKPSVAKVLKPMARPDAEAPVEPLVVFWTALHPQGKPEPHFSLPTGGGSFPRVHVFSISNYLRGLRDVHLDLDLPKTVERLKWLRQLFAHVS